MKVVLCFSIHSVISKLIFCCQHSAGSSIFSDDMSGRADAKSEFQYLSCSSSADKLLQCSIITSCGPAACQRQYGLQCYSKCAFYLQFLLS